MAKTISCSQFTQFIVDEQPHYDEYIIKAIRPSDSWIAHVTSGTFDAGTGTQHFRDRFEAVYPNVTKTWLPVTSAGCLGTPCDKDEHLIGWGSTRLNYALEQQSWQTPLLCFDQLMLLTHAQEQFSYIISDILAPAVSWVQSSFIRKRGAMLADNKFIANKNFASAASNFTFTWVLVGNEEQYIDTNCPPTSVFKLTPQMLQRMVDPMLRIGYLGKKPFDDSMSPPMLELVTSSQTQWELDKLGAQQGSTGTAGASTTNSPNVVSNWRFTQWDAANKYWRYGFGGQIGNYAVRVDPYGLRFNFVGVVAGKYRYQVVLPYKNIPSSGAGSQAGLKSVSNSDFDNCQFEFSYIWHAKGIQLQTFESQAINPDMPFARRNFAGRWQFVMDNLGADQFGCVIENKRRNKGQWINDFQQAVAPDHTEFLTLIFNKREPSCIIEINTCNSDVGYPTQSYSSANTSCADTGSSSGTPSNTVVTFTPVLNLANADYEVEANSALCEGSPVQHPAISGTTTLAALVIQLNSVLNVLGAWAVSGSNITLTGPCNTASLPFAV